MEWIDTDERLPETNQGKSEMVLIHVITWRKDEWDNVGYYDATKGTWFVLRDNIFERVDVSHWIQIPKVPPIPQEKWGRVWEPGKAG